MPYLLQNIIYTNLVLCGLNLLSAANRITRNAINKYSFTVSVLRGSSTPFNCLWRMAGHTYGGQIHRCWLPGVFWCCFLDGLRPVPLQKNYLSVLTYYCISSHTKFNHPSLMGKVSLLCFRFTCGVIYPQHSEAKRGAWESIHPFCNDMALQSIYLHYWNPWELRAHCLCHGFVDHYLSHEWYNFYFFISPSQINNIVLVS